MMLDYMMLDYMVLDCMMPDCMLLDCTEVGCKKVGCMKEQERVYFGYRELSWDNMNPAEVPGRIHSEEDTLP